MTEQITRECIDHLRQLNNVPDPTDFSERAKRMRCTIKEAKSAYFAEKEYDQKRREQLILRLEKYLEKIGANIY